MSNKEGRKKVKRLREGSRCIGLAAINRSGSGAHINRKDKRKSNPKKKEISES